MKTPHPLLTKIVVTTDGPYLVSGGLPPSEQRFVIKAEGESLDYKEEKVFPASPSDELPLCGQA